jgi:SAM-dependent methyltransferase
LHQSAMNRMNESIEKYMSKDKHYEVLDFGSFINKGQVLNHRPLLANYDVNITGVDIQAGNNVDIQMTKPYRIPVASGSQDIVLSGQVFEHIPFPWASIMEIARVLKPKGYLFMTVPSRGHHHSTYDCWRYYPDTMRALAAHADLNLLAAYTDFPPNQPGTDRHDYAAIDIVDHYWGDTTAVFQKPLWKSRRSSLRRYVVREMIIWNANRIGDLSLVPRPKRRRL